MPKPSIGAFAAARSIVSQRRTTEAGRNADVNTWASETLNDEIQVALMDRQSRQVAQIEAFRLPATQPERVDRLEQRGISLSGQPALTTSRPDLLHHAVRSVEQRLHLVVGQGPPAGVSDVGRDADDRVPLVQQLAWCRAEPLAAGCRPSVPLVERHSG